MLPHSDDLTAPRQRVSVIRASGDPVYSARMQSVDSIVTRLLALHPKLIDLSLDRMWRIARPRSAIRSASCRR